VVVLLWQPRHRHRAHHADVADDDREGAAVGGELALVEEVARLDRRAVELQAEPHEVRGVPEAAHDAVLAADPRVVV
jgi:hypothetical protein